MHAHSSATHSRRRGLWRAAVLGLTIATVAATELTFGLAPANAGTVAVTGRIQGAGSIRSVEGGPYACFADGNQDDRSTATCQRETFGAVFEAWVWLEAVPASTPAGNWRFARWEGCNTTRVVDGNLQCAVHSGAFTLDETMPKAVFDDFVPPTVSSIGGLSGSWRGAGCNNFSLITRLPEETGTF